MIANYIIIDDMSLFELEGLDIDDFFNKIEEFQDMEEDFPICDIDKIWNGLYFMLTGKSEPDDLEPEDFTEYAKNIFVFGEEYFDTDEFTSCIRNKTLKEILPEIEKINFKDFYNYFDIKIFEKAEIYPNIWKENEKELIFEEMEMAFEEMKALFKKALKLGKNILVTIY